MDYLSADYNLVTSEVFDEAKTENSPPSSKKLEELAIKAFAQDPSASMHYLMQAGQMDEKEGSYPLYNAFNPGEKGSLNPRGKVIEKNCARLYATLIKKAIQEGKKGNHHKEASLLFHADYLLFHYHSGGKIPYGSIEQSMHFIERMGNTTYLMIGMLDFKHFREKTMWTEELKKLITSCPMMSAVPSLQNLEFQTKEELLLALSIAKDLTRVSPKAKQAIYLLNMLLRVEQIEDAVQHKTPTTLIGKRIEAMTLVVALDFAIEKFNVAINRYKTHLEHLDEEIAKEETLFKQANDITNEALRNEVQGAFRTSIQKNKDEKNRIIQALQDIGMRPSYLAHKASQASTPQEVTDTLKTASIKELATYKEDTIARGKEIVTLTKKLTEILPDPNALSWD